MLWTALPMENLIGTLGHRLIGYGVATALFFILISFIRSASTNRTTDEFGYAAPSPPHVFPLGIDLLGMALRRIARNEFCEWVREMLNIPGHTISMNLLGTQIILTDDVENIRAVLSTQFSQFGKGEEFHKIWFDLMANSIFSTDGDLWHSNKTHLRNHTAKSRPSDYETTEKHVTILLRNLSDGGAHDCLHQMDRFVLDLVSDVFFGESAGTLLSAEQPLREAVEAMYEWNTRKSLLGGLGALLPGNKHASNVLDKYLDEVIDRATARMETKGEEATRLHQTLLASLLSNGTDKSRIKDQMLAILIGGKDPGAIVMVWIMYELTRHPNIMDRLRQEIRQTVGFDSLPTPKQMRSIPLLQNTIKEVLRLHTPLGFNIRTARADTSLPHGGGSDGCGPVAVRKGTHTILAYASLQCRHDLIGHTADDFDPDRWDNWAPALWEYLPFNHGPRICLGRNFAWAMIENVVCRVCQTFERVELVGRNVDDKMKVKIALNTKPAEPVMVLFHKAM